MKAQGKQIDTKGGRGSWMRAVSSVVAASAALSGCIIVDPGPANYEPYISELYVDCFYDSYYRDYGWEFIAYVEDGNGPLDVAEVFVDVINVYIDPYTIQETWDLVYDGGGQWSQLVYETYSRALVCEFFEDFEFDFYATDYYGATDSVTYVPYYY